MPKYAKNRPHKKEKLLVVALAVLCLCILSGSTLAYLITGTGPISHIFTPGTVSCEVVKENETEAEGYANHVRIKNTGTVQAYIRAAIVVTFEKVDKDGNITVSSITPDEGDYIIQFAENTNWKKGPDGFWYFTKPVDAGASTDELILYCHKQKSVAPEGYTLTVKVVASAIQASGTSAVTESWSSGVKKLDGNTLVIKEASGK